MKNILKITSVLFLVIEIGSTDAIAKPRYQHTIGFLTSRSAGGNNGFCSYSVIGKAENRVVLHTSGGEASIKIDENEISLKLVKHKESISKQGKSKNYVNVYNSEMFNVKTKFVVASVGRNKSQNELIRESGIMSVNSTDGWGKNINVECTREVIIGY